MFNQCMKPSIIRPSSILLILFGKLSAGMSETTSAQRLSPGVLITGGGLITFAIADDLRSYVLRLPGRRHEPSPDAFDEFVETSLSSPDRTKLATWIAELRR